MVLRVTNSSKNYHLRPCPHCGGSLYLDKEDREWRCLNCARRPERPISTTDNSISTDNNAITTGNKGISVSRNFPSAGLLLTETPAISKGRRPFIPAQGPEKIYKGHSIAGIWWPPKEITFRRRQMLFLIKNLPELREGYWPANPAGSGYIDMPIVKKGGTGRHRAYFETPASTAAEVEVRLEKCGIDGLILLAIECWGESEESLAKYFRMPVWSIRKRAKNALRYISGWERKKQSYKESPGSKVSSTVN